MELNFRIKSFTSNLGDVIEVDPSGVTCIVGANNVGKSRLLRDIKILLVDTYGEEPVVLTSVRQVRSLQDQLGSERFEHLSNGTWDSRADSEVTTWLRSNAEGHGVDQQGSYKYAPSGSGIPIQANEFLNELQQSRLGGNVYKFFLQDNLVNSPLLSGQFSSSDGLGELDASYMAMFHRGSETEEEISEIFDQVFGEKLVYDAATGYNGLRVGEIDGSLLTSGRPKEQYTDNMRELPKLRDQGSGMQYFLGSVAALVLGPAQVILLDEPETYLHPPQARALGRFIGKEAARRNKQVIVVSHDNNFVIGLLESNENLRFVRITRGPEGNRLKQVTTTSIKGIWEKAVLRYSNILSGLFYKQVIICESDSDCRFFSAILEDLVEKNSLDRHLQETLFIPSAGIDGIPQRAKALSDLHVEVKVIVDFDIILTDIEKLKNIVGSLNATWTPELANDYNLTKSETLNSVSRETAKKSGRSVVPPGNAAMALKRLLGSLKNIGIHVIPEGEMESFRKTTKKNKERWVDESLELKFHHEEGRHREFVRGMFSVSR